MKRILAGVVCGLAALGFSLPGDTCCCVPRYHVRQQKVDPMRLAQQKAFIFREGKNEHLVLSVRYEGGTADFAWIIPVEGKPKVDVLNGAPFNELHRLTEIPEPAQAGGRMEARASAPSAKSVQVIERKEAGPYDLAVLKASDAGGLYQWLKANQFNVSKDARGAFDHYVQRDFYFVAARIRPKSTDNQTVAARLRGGTIAPLHMIYPTTHLSYPLKVTTGNPGPSQMDMYVLEDEPLANPGKLGFRANTFLLSPLGEKGFRVSGPSGANNPRGLYPTLRGLIPKGGKLTHYSGTLQDSQRQKDLVFD